jgi:mono/diheme cytochrome c family protein
MPVKSWLNGPGADGVPVLAGLNTLYGVAFSGERGVEAVEVSADDGATWQHAEWVGPDLGPDAWRTFQFAANLPVGGHRFVTRAIDTQGDRQPKLAVHNHRGYGHNGWQDHGLSVRAVAELPKTEIKASLQASDPTADSVSASIAGLALSEKALDGKQLFIQQAQPGCGVCHSLADANARGVVGPNLNQLSPSLAQVESAVAQGVGAMPAYGAQLSQGEIEALAAYVFEATR